MCDLIVAQITCAEAKSKRCKSNVRVRYIQAMELRADLTLTKPSSRVTANTGVQADIHPAGWSVFTRQTLKPLRSETKTEGIWNGLSVFLPYCKCESRPFVPCTFWPLQCKTSCLQNGQALSSKGLRYAIPGGGRIRPETQGTPVEIWREHLCKCAQLRRDDEKKEIEIYGHSKAWLELELFCKSRKPQIIFLYQVHPGLRIAGPFYLSCDLQTPLSWLQGCVGFWWNLLRFTAKSYAWMAWWWRWPIATRAIDIENKANI